MATFNRHIYVLCRFSEMGNIHFRSFWDDFGTWNFIWWWYSHVLVSGRWPENIDAWNIDRYDRVSCSVHCFGKLCDLIWSECRIIPVFYDTVLYHGTRLTGTDLQSVLPSSCNMSVQRLGTSWSKNKALVSVWLSRANLWWNSHDSGISDFRRRKVIIMWSHARTDSPQKHFTKNLANAS